MWSDWSRSWGCTDCQPGSYTSCILLYQWSIISHFVHHCHFLRNNHASLWQNKHHSMHCYKSSTQWVSIFDHVQIITMQTLGRVGTMHKNLPIMLALCWTDDWIAECQQCEIAIKYTGKMTLQDKVQAVSRFLKGDISVLVATEAVKLGVDNHQWWGKWQNKGWNNCKLHVCMEIYSIQLITERTCHRHCLIFMVGKMTPILNLFCAK